MGLNQRSSDVAPSWARSGLAQLFKDFLTRLGFLCPKILITLLDSSLHYLEGGRWMREHSFEGFKRVKSREEIFSYVASQVANAKLLYLEFGVHEGRTIRQLSEMIRAESAAFHGFDSFEGLPERWNRFNKRGHFSTKGRLPEINDSRIQFFKGWFNEVLPSYRLPEHEVLFINIDCDLYSSASTVLLTLAPEIKIGSYLYFDEFYDRNNEMKAFEEFLEVTGYKFECLMTTRGLAHAVFRRIA